MVLYFLFSKECKLSVGKDGDFDQAYVSLNFKHAKVKNHDVLVKRIAKYFSVDSSFITIISQDEFEKHEFENLTTLNFSISNKNRITEI